MSDSWPNLQKGVWEGAVKDVAISVVIWMRNEKAEGSEAQCATLMFSSHISFVNCTAHIASCDPVKWTKQWSPLKKITFLFYSKVFWRTSEALRGWSL